MYQGNNSKINASYSIGLFPQVIIEKGDDFVLGFKTGLFFNRLQGFEITKNNLFDSNNKLIGLETSTLNLKFDLISMPLVIRTIEFFKGFSLILGAQTSFLINSKGNLAIKTINTNVESTFSSLNTNKLGFCLIGGFELNPHWRKAVFLTQHICFDVQFLYGIVPFESDKPIIQNARTRQILFGVEYFIHPKNYKF